VTPSRILVTLPLLIAAITPVSAHARLVRLDALLPGQVESQFGNAIAGGGDFNGDGAMDFAVAGHDLDSTTGAGTGAVWIYYGPFTDMASFDWDLKIPSPIAGNQNFGWSLEFAGNFQADADGDNLVVGSNANGTSETWVYYFENGQLMRTDLDFPSATCFTINDAHGRSVAGGGDFDGDGYADIAVGSFPSTGEGYVAVYRGRANAVSSLAPDFLFVGESNGDHFGEVVGWLPDRDADGRDELMVLAGDHGSDLGTLYVFDGRAVPGGSPPIYYVDACPGSPCSGYACSGDGGDVRIDDVTGAAILTMVGAPDTNGDGVSDLAIGATDDVFVFWDAGSLSGSMDLDDAQVRVQNVNPEASAQDGLGVADLDGDGLSDILIGGAGNLPGGRVGIVLGCQASTPYTVDLADLDLTLLPEETLPDVAGDQFGFSVVGVGDFTGDGVDDFVVGAKQAGPGGDDGGDDPGAAYLYTNVPVLFTRESKATTNIDYVGTAYAAVSLNYDGGGEDLLVSRRGGGSPVLYENQGMAAGVPQFVDRTGSRVAFTLPQSVRGVAIGDIDNDGDPDVFLAHPTEPILMTYDATISKFVDSSSLLENAQSVSYALDSWAGTWTDYDRDGWLDLFLSKATGTDNVATINPMDDVLLRNTRGSGPLGFEDVTSASGLSGSGIASVSSAWTDLDLDGDPDLVVGSLSDSEDSRLYLNDGDGTFTDTGLMGNTRRVSGVSMADLNGDDDEEMILAQREAAGGTAILVCRYDSPTSIPEETWSYALADTMALNAVVPLDFDLNGTMDLLALPSAPSASPRLLRNAVASSGRFGNFFAGSGIDAGGIAGASVSDFNSDGDIDLFFGRDTSLDEHFYQNREGVGADGPASRWLSVEVVGGNGNNRYGIGTKVELLIDGAVVQTQFVDGGSGRGSQESRVLTFGVGRLCESAELRATWPDGYISTKPLTTNDFDQKITLYDTHGLDFVGGLTVTWTPIVGQRMLWTFEWVTNYSSPWFHDDLTVVQMSGCEVFPPTLGGSVVKKVASGYQHTITIETDCVGGCRYTFKPKSKVQVWDVNGAVDVAETPALSKVFTVPACIQ